MNYKERLQSVENLEKAIQVVIDASCLSHAMKAKAVANVLSDRLSVLDLALRNKLKGAA